MIKSLKEFRKELAAIGSVNLEEYTMVNALTGEEADKVKWEDTDRNFFWIFERVENDQYKLVYQASSLF